VASYILFPPSLPLVEEEIAIVGEGEAWLRIPGQAGHDSEIIPGTIPK
jgi:hypothetical protein